MVLVQKGIIAQRQAALPLLRLVHRERTNLLREEELVETVLYAPWASIAQEQPLPQPTAPQVNLVAFPVSRLLRVVRVKLDANLVSQDGNAQVHAQSTQLLAEQVFTLQLEPRPVLHVQGTTTVIPRPPARHRPQVKNVIMAIFVIGQE